MTYRTWGGAQYAALLRPGAGVTVQRLPAPAGPYGGDYRPVISHTGNDAVVEASAAALNPVATVVLWTAGGASSGGPAPSTSRCDGSQASRSVRFLKIDPEFADGAPTGNLLARLEGTRPVRGAIVALTGARPVAARWVAIRPVDGPTDVLLRLPAAERARVAAGTARLRLVVYDRAGRVVGEARYGD